jgi:hypothetical protein
VTSLELSLADVGARLDVEIGIRPADPDVL